MGIIPYRVTNDRNDYKVYGFVFESEFEKDKYYNVDIIVEENLSEDDLGELNIKRKIVDVKCQCYSHKYNDKVCKHIKQAIEYFKRKHQNDR